MRTPASKLLRFSLLWLLVALSLGPGLGQSKSTKVKAPVEMEGWVSDEKCGAKDVDNADCAKKCAEAGSKLVFVSEKDKSILNVDNQDALRGHEGHHVKVVGQVDNGTLHVTRVVFQQQCDGQACDQKQKCIQAKDKGSPRCQSQCRCSKS